MASQHLIYDGKHLEDQLIFFDYNISKDSTILLAIKMPQGATVKGGILLSKSRFKNIVKNKSTSPSYLNLSMSISYIMHKLEEIHGLKCPPNKLVISI